MSPDDVNHGSVGDRAPGAERGFYLGRPKRPNGISADETEAHILEQPWEDTTAQREEARKELERMMANLDTLLAGGKPRTVMAFYWQLCWMAYPEQRRALEEAQRAVEEAERSDLERALAMLRERGQDFTVSEAQEGDASGEPARLFWRCGGPGVSDWSFEEVRCAVLAHSDPEGLVLFFDWAENNIGYSVVHGGKHVFYEPQQSG